MAYQCQKGHSHPSPGAGGVLLFKISPSNGAISILLELRSKAVAGPNRWGIPGGYSLKGEKIYATALRELEEELGIKQDDVRHPPGAANKDAVFIDDHGGWMYVTFILTSSGNRALDRENLKLSAESQDAQWFSIKQLPGDSKLLRAFLSTWPQLRSRIIGVAASMYRELLINKKVAHIQDMGERYDEAQKYINPFMKANCGAWCTEEEKKWYREVMKPGINPVTTTPQALPPKPSTSVQIPMPNIGKKTVTKPLETVPEVEEPPETSGFNTPTQFGSLAERYPNLWTLPNPETDSDGYVKHIADSIWNVTERMHTLGSKLWPNGGPPNV